MQIANTVLHSYKHKTKHNLTRSAFEIVCSRAALHKAHKPMLLLAADENFNNNIVRGLLRRAPHLDIIRVQDVGLSGADDPTVLDWAAREGRVLLTHDVETITFYAYERLRVGLAMPGVFEVSRSIALGQAIDDILLLASASNQGEWEGLIRYLPLR